MKNLVFILISTIAFSNISAQTAEIKNNISDFYFEKSKNKWNEGNLTWKKKGDFAILRVRYFRGDCCGGVPNAEQITAQITGDTIFYNSNYKRIPDCRSDIGICGNAIDIAINTKKYKNYKKMVLKEVSTFKQ